MKIAYCTDSICYAGGIQRVTIAKANKLALKNEVWIIVTDNKDKPVFPLSTKVHLVNCDINYFEDDWKSRFYILKGIIYKRKQHKKRLKEILNQIQPDIVHIHTLHGYYMNFQILWNYLNKHDIPCVWTFHDCHAFTGNCGYYFACRRWENGCGSCPDKKRYPKSQFFDFSRYMWKKKKEWFTKGDRKIIVTPSDWLTEETKKSFFGKYPCVTIRNGIDAEHTFYPRDKAECRKKYGFTIRLH